MANKNTPRPPPPKKMNPWPSPKSFGAKCTFLPPIPLAFGLSLEMQLNTNHNPNPNPRGYKSALAPKFLPFPSPQVLKLFTPPLNGNKKDEDVKLMKKPLIQH